MIRPGTCLRLAPKRHSGCGGLLWVSAALLLLPACSPSLYPLYRDYEVGSEEAPLERRLEEALSASGWTRAPASAPNAIATNERRVRSWGLYTVVVSLEAVPVGENHVRLYVHPFRKYITGGRSKIPFLKGSIRRAVLKDLDAAMQTRSIIAVGTGISRDRERAQ